ncbi:MAG: carbohydrate kinase family protein [Candidatus Nanopelagicaceae bacterium]|nr:carbohydrate kinase family protein [Candidatus Nanopelagicaceae bacterium]
MTKILCIGDAMIDVIVQLKSPINVNSDTLSEISMHGGGAAANTATWLAHLGVTTSFVGRIGADISGANFHAELAAFGVQHENPSLEGEKTGTVVVLVDQNGNRTMFPDAGANSGLSASDLPNLAGVDGVFLSGYSLFNSKSSDGVLGIIKAIKELSIPIFFDVASVGTMSAFGKERAISLIKGFDGLFMNESEAEYLTGFTNAQDQFRLLEAFAPLIVIKRGANGAIARFNGRDPISKAAREAKVIDTTGAGDAFAAGFLASWLNSKDLDGAISHALDVAAQCVATIGARPRVNP